MKPFLARWLTAAVAGACLWTPIVQAAEAAPDPGLTALRSAPHRSPAFVARDSARKPAEVLQFFGLKPELSVVEISPGGGYWVELLAPYLRERGHYRVTSARAPDARSRVALQAKLAAQPALYDQVQIGVFAKGDREIAPAGSADMVLTFRNLHNWMSDGEAETALAAFYAVLKPGGVLGIEEHRGRSDQPQDPKAESGYVREDYTIELARRAGFELVARSELLANSRDTKDYPGGVWTLPPTLTLGEQDRARYLAIGEADNFLLKFRKPLR